MSGRPEAWSKKQVQLSEDERTAMVLSGRLQLVKRLLVCDHTGQHLLTDGSRLTNLDEALWMTVDKDTHEQVHAIAYNRVKKQISPGSQMDDRKIFTIEVRVLRRMLRIHTV